MRAVLGALRLLLAVLRRPDLWGTALGVAIRFAPDGRLWPTHEFLAYRAQAVYGQPLLEVPPDEVVRYLEWCRTFPGPIR